LAAAEGTFDYRAYLQQLGIYYQLDAASEQDWQIISSPAQHPLADRFRMWARQALALGLPVEDESLRLEWALTLGWKTALTEEVSEPLSAPRPTIFLRWTACAWRSFSGSSLGFCGNQCATRSLWSGADSVDLVLHRTDWLAGFGDSGHSHADCHCLWMAAETAKRFDQFAICRRADHFGLATATALSSRISTLVLRRLCILLSIPLLRDLWERIGRPDPLLPEVFISALAHYPARSWSIRQRSPLTSFAAWNWLHPTGRILFSHCDAGEYASEFAGRAVVRTGFDEQSGKFAVCGLVSGRSDSIEPCWMVSHGMHPRFEPLVCGLAPCLLLRLGTEAFY